MSLCQMLAKDSCRFCSTIQDNFEQLISKKMVDRFPIRIAISAQSREPFSQKMETSVRGGKSERINRSNWN